MNEIEEKLRIENETLALKREYKYALENLSRVKADTNEILATREKVTKEIAERTEDLNKVLLEISTAKLNWMNEKQVEVAELAEKNAQADNVIKRKAELNQQEEVIRQIQASDIEIRNETRRLELKLENDRIALEAREKQFQEDKENAEIKHQKDLKEIQDFKKRVQKVLQEVEKI